MESILCTEELRRRPWRKSDYQREKDVVVDVVFDAVGGETLRRSWRVLKPAGRMVTIAASEEAVVDERIKQTFFIVEPNQKQLAEVGSLLYVQRHRTFVGGRGCVVSGAGGLLVQVRKRGPAKVVVAVTAQVGESEGTTMVDVAHRSRGSEK